MDHKNYMRIAFLIVLLAIIYSFNGIFFFKVKLFNILNIILFILIILNVVRWHLDNIGYTPLFDYLICFSVFLSGINIRYKIKFFLFLAILYLIYSTHHFIYREKGKSIIDMNNIIIILGKSDYTIIFCSKLFI